LEDEFQYDIGLISVDQENEIYSRKQWSSPSGEPYYSWESSEGLPSWLKAVEIVDRYTRTKGIRQKGLGKGLIYHYTGIEGLKGILDSQEVWLTDYAYLNDSAELRHGLGLFEEKIRSKLLDEKYQVLADIFKVWLENIQNHRYRICIASYSLNGDSLSQWRAYGSIAIGFEPSYVIAGGECQFDSVIYDQSEQDGLVEFFLNHTLQAFKFDTHNGTQRGGLDVLEMYQDGLNQVIRLAALFKDEGFRDEREVRVAFVEDPALYERIGIARAPKRFRANKHAIIPYVTTRDVSRAKEGTPLPIREIITGPTISDIGRKSISEYLDHLGFTDVIVRPSKVPFRN
jgi:hypothetical protein